MSRIELLDDLQKNANEIKDIADGLGKDGKNSITSLGNLSFLVALLQEQVEKLIKDAKKHK